MQLSRKAARVSIVRQDSRYETFVFANSLTVGPEAGSVRIAARQKASPRGGADRVLDERVRERHGLAHELPQVRRVYVVVI